MNPARPRKTLRAPGRHDPLLDPRTASAIERAPDLDLTARTMVEGLYQGRHQTRQRGASTEFYDFRAYTPGDPAQRVDWKVFGRTDRLYVRRFRHTSQLTVMLVVDRSASMNFAGFRDGTTTKDRRARELAAALAFLAVRQSDRVGLILSAGTGTIHAVPPAAGRNALHAIISALESNPVEEHGNERPDALAAGIEAAARMLTRRSLIIALSDALDEPESILATAAQVRHGAGALSGGGGHDLALIQTLTPDELDLSALAGARLIDSESRAAVRTMGRDIASRYQQAINDHLRTIREGFTGLGARAMTAMTSDPPIESLRAFLSHQ